jgi:HrpA-like RNA helicase
MLPNFNEEFHTPGWALALDSAKRWVCPYFSEVIFLFKYMCYRPKGKQALADRKKATFIQPEGDHLTLLSVYNSWKSNRFSKTWCYENFAQMQTLKRAQDIRKQLVEIMDR